MFCQQLRDVQMCQVKLCELAVLLTTKLMKLKQLASFQVCFPSSIKLFIEEIMYSPMYVNGIAWHGEILSD